MRQRASLDIIADDRRAPAAAHTHESESNGGDGDGEQDPLTLNHIQEDSRSTSSTSSPAPADNDESDFFHGLNDSQSSLGVPNLQDMQVDDECLPPVNRLPNEILISVFAKLNASSDLLHVMLTCKRWSRNAVDLLWHRPACSSWEKHALICQTLGIEAPYFSYKDFIRRINLAALADKVNDGSVMPLAACTRVERLTLTGCEGLTDSGLIGLVENSSHLLALDISLDEQITEASMFAIAENCHRLQGLNVSGCTKISNESLVKLAESCRYIKRLKLNDCSQLNDESVLAFAEHCPNILEIDLHQCRGVGNDPITALLAKGQSLRELRLANCELIEDSAFLSLPLGRTYEHLRILDLTSCARLTDRAVEKIIDVAPRLRNLVLAKCRNITDAAVYAIARLKKNLHYVHLGHCGHITDDAVKVLVRECNRIRYIDLGCCIHLTDDSVTRLATLPKLKRIGLVKCNMISDESVYALARANHRMRPRRDANGNYIPGEPYTSSSSLERVHLSYCTNLTLKSIVKLLNSCPRLTHLSLTGVQAFLRDDLEAFCRDAPPEFTEHQRQVFCVFSGQGVVNLRRYLTSERNFAELHEPLPAAPRPNHPPVVPIVGPPAEAHAHNQDMSFEDEDDVVDEEEFYLNETDMTAEQPQPQPLQPPQQAPQQAMPTLQSGQVPPHRDVTSLLPGTAPHATPPIASPNPFDFVGGHPPYVPQQVHHQAQFPDGSGVSVTATAPRPIDSDDEDGYEVMDFAPAGLPGHGHGHAYGVYGAAAQFGASQSGPSTRRRQASHAGPSSAAGPSTAPIAIHSFLPSVRDRPSTSMEDSSPQNPLSRGGSTAP